MLKADVKADVDSLFESLAKAKHNMILAKAKHNMISVILNGQNGQPHNPHSLSQILEWWQARDNQTPEIFCSEGFETNKTRKKVDYQLPITKVKLEENTLIWYQGVEKHTLEGIGAIELNQESATVKIMYTKDFSEKNPKDPIHMELEFKYLT
jgi:hypothetical protein